MSRRDARPSRARHALDPDGMVRCNPRDREAAHRAQVDDLATTDDPSKVTCRKCLSAGSQPRERLLRDRPQGKEDEGEQEERPGDEGGV